MKIHYLKTEPFYFSASSRAGGKNFEIRKNDRDYEEGDILTLQEYDDDRGYEPYTGRQIGVLVCYMMKHKDFPGIQPGYCVMGVERIDK